MKITLLQAKDNEIARLQKQVENLRIDLTDCVKLQKRCKHTEERERMNLCVRCGAPTWEDNDEPKTRNSVPIASDDFSENAGLYGVFPDSAADDPW